MVDCFVLLNSGDFVLLNDGTSKVIMNSCDAPVDTGVIIEGTHPLPLIGSFDPKPKRRVREWALTALAKLTRRAPLPSTKTKISTRTESIVKARLSRIITESAVTKVTRLTTLPIDARSYHVIENKIHLSTRRLSEHTTQVKDTILHEMTAKAYPYHKVDEKLFQHAKDIQQLRRQAKIAKLKEAFEDYKDEDIE
jgi:hypothetical protein